MVPRQYRYRRLLEDRRNSSRRRRTDRFLLGFLIQNDSLGNRIENYFYTTMNTIDLLVDIDKFLFPKVLVG